MSYGTDPNNSKKQGPAALPSNWTTVMNTPYQTGSVMLQDDDSLVDAGGDARLTYTDDGALILKDEDGNAGITLNTNLTTTFAAGVTVTTGGVTATAGGLTVTAGQSALRGTITTGFQPAQATTDDGTTAISAANVLTGIIQCTPTGDHNKATDTAANFISTLGLTVNGDSFDFSIINLATDGTSHVTLTYGATGITGVGCAVISAQDLVENAFTSGVGRFRIRRTGAAAVTIYRIA